MNAIEAVRPVVIIVNDVNHRDLKDESVLNFMEYIAGARPRFVDATVPNWWLTRPQFVEEEFDCYASEVAKENPELDASNIRQYMESYEFGIYVLDGLLNAVESSESCGSHGFARDAVRLIVLETGFEFSVTITEASKDYLPNAVICNEDSERVSHPFTEHIDELALEARTTRTLQERNLTQIGWLVENDEAGLLEFVGIGKKSLAQIKAALAQYGLELRQE